jgi:threonine aldolase
MRQAGIIAAAGLVALDTMVDRLADDHARASRLAGAVADRFPDAGCDPAAVQTNVVLFSPPNATSVLDQLEAEGVLATTIAPGLVRLMTHLDVDDGDVERVAKAIAALR